MKHKTKDPIQQRWKRLRAAIRNVWQFDISRKEVIKKSNRKVYTNDDRAFECPLCHKVWPLELVTVDHDPPLGSFDSWNSFFRWTQNCFEGNMRAICKPCHKKVTALQRRKK